MQKKIVYKHYEEAQTFFKAILKVSYQMDDIVFFTRLMRELFCARFGLYPEDTRQLVNKDYIE